MPFRLPAHSGQDYITLSQGVRDFFDGVKAGRIYHRNW
jgi:hypothetical protein